MIFHVTAGTDVIPLCQKAAAFPEIPFSLIKH